jgi:hypothetical protein
LHPDDKLCLRQASSQLRAAVDAGSRALCFRPPPRSAPQQPFRHTAVLRCGQGLQERGCRPERLELHAVRGFTPQLA